MSVFVNPLGIHALCWTAEVDGAAMRSACEGSRDAGFDQLEVALLQPGKVDVAGTRDALRATGLRVSCSTGLSFATDISSTDPAVVDRGRAHLLDCLAVASDIGADFLGGVLYSAMDKYRERATAAGRANCVAVLRELGAAAHDRGITIGLEPVNRYESNLVNTVGQAIDLIGDIGSDDVVVHLDSYHANIEEVDQATPVRQAAAAGLLGYVHIGESHRGHLGSGQADLRELVAALLEVGYEGPIVFESFSSAVTSEPFVASLAVWRDLWQDSTALAAGAHRYLEDTLRRLVGEVPAAPIQGSPAG